MRNPRAVNPTMKTTNRNILQLLLIVVPFVLLWGVLALGFHDIWVTQKDKLFDFYPRWHGAREMLRGTDPYSDEMNRTILADMGYEYYTPYKHNFMYPATVTWVLLPFWLVPWSVSISLWSSLQLMLMTVLPVLVFLQLGWRIPPRRLLLITLFSALIYRHAMNVYLLGQFQVFILACLLIAWALLQTEKHPWLAALALIGPTIRPEGVIIVAVILADLLLRRRYKPVIIWGGLMGVVFLLSVLPIGFWIPDFLHVTSGYRECCTYTEPTKVLGIGGSNYVIGALSLAWGVWMLWTTRTLPENERTIFGLAILLLLFLLVMTQTKNYTLVYALLPIWLIIWLARDHGWGLAIGLALLASPWLYVVASREYDVKDSVEQLLLPAISAALLTVLYWRLYRPAALETSES